MNLKEKKIKVDLDNPKQIYEYSLLNCRLEMQNRGIRNVFQVYCEFHNLKQTAELRVRFDYFWRGSTRDEVLLSKYQEFIKSLENAN